MPLFRRGRPLKRWRYVGVYAPELMLCVGDARVAGLRQRWWAVALPDGSLFEGSGSGPIELSLEESPEGVEVVSPHGRSYIWTRKQAGISVNARVRLPKVSCDIHGRIGFVDDSAGYQW
jgi:hypothetical protein